MKDEGVITVISGFSGAGKGTLVSKLMEKSKDYVLSVSATSRSMRKGEQEGISYFFKTADEFEQMIKDGMFVEYTRYVDNYYGTPKAFVENAIRQGKNVILEIEVEGAFHVKEFYPEALLIFVAPPHASDIEKRLKNRDSETDETIAKRMFRAREESYLMERYDYILVNDDAEEAANRLDCIIRTYNDRAFRKKTFISAMQRELENDRR